MCDLRDLLAAAPYRAPFTSDDVNGSMAPSDCTLGADPKVLLALAVFFRCAKPNGTWREFTRWLS